MAQHITRLLLIIIGIVAVFFGMIGVFLPVLPTTPFILLAAFCFVHSSPRFHHWLTQNRYLGPIVDAFSGGRGIPRRIRKRAVLMIWMSLVTSMILLGKWWVVPLLSLVGASVTFYLYRLPAYDEVVN